LFACGNTASTTSTSSSSSALTFETQSLTINKLSGGTLSLTVEVADTTAKRAQGLMNRQSMDQDRGMLFYFDTEIIHSFWMKDTYISLDIIFINSSKTIVHIEESTTPLSLDSIVPSASSLYVLEVNSGYVQTNEVNVGDTLTF